MPHMIAYLAGDSDTMASRKAVREDVRIAVELPDERRMLVVCVMQTGEITMTWTSSQGTGRIDEMYLIGALTPMGPKGDQHTFDLNVGPVLIPITPATHFNPLAKNLPDEAS